MSRSRQKILIVDDRSENLIALRKVLTEVDVEVIAAHSGNEALTATLNHRFALAILDVMMPEMDGYELAGLLRGDESTHRLRRRSQRHLRSQERGQRTGQTP